MAASSSSKSTLTLKFAGDTSELQAALAALPEDVQKQLGVTQKVVEQHTDAATTAHEGHGAAVKKLAGHVMAAGGAVAAVGGGITAALDPLTEALGKSQDLTSQLGASLKDSGQDVDGWQEQLERAEASNRKLGITNEDTIQSVQSLVQAGVPYQEALTDQGELADLAASQHMSLAQAADMVGRAMNGRVNPALKAMGVTTADTTSLTQLLGITQNKVGGEAQASASTVAGSMRVWKAEVGNVAEAVGNKLLPVIQVVGPVMAGMGSAMTVAGGAVEGFRKVQELFKGETEAATAATEAQTVATDAAAASEGVALGPILLIVAGVAALIAVVVLIVTHFQKFKDILGDVGNFIKGVFVGYFDFMRDHISAVVGDVVGFFTSIPGKIGGIAGAIGGIFKDVLNAPIGLINGLIDGINTILSHVPLQGHFGIPNFGAHAIPQIPKFHSGGIVPGAPGSEMMAILQAGERVIPANGAGSGSPMAPTVNIVANTNASARDIAREASWALRRGGY